MKTKKTSTKTDLVNQVLENIGNDLREKRYVNPQYFRENMDYFRRQAELHN